ncbi:hypothetical protein FHR33_000760 [Nonomuraea dietziae]|uniref:Uncharacterized protein n=1 Tax=Nonomuraea dietziae TaxID=65515 RepID=A0A7W5V4J0_9ACTN|nr:hypothetical protein [Nonomuraea dietziae]
MTSSPALTDNGTAVSGNSSSTRFLANVCSETITETLRAPSAVAAIAWCVWLSLIGYLWARATFTKRA